MELIEAEVAEDDTQVFFSYLSLDMCNIVYGMEFN